MLFSSAETVPFPKLLDLKWKTISIAAGARHIMALSGMLEVKFIIFELYFTAEDGVVYAWGHNAFGEIGAGPICPSVVTTPRAVVRRGISLYATRIFDDINKEEKKLRKSIAKLLEVCISLSTSL